MRLHEQNVTRASALAEAYDDLMDIVARMDRKVRMPDGDGERSSMVNWDDIRSDILRAAYIAEMGRPGVSSTTLFDLQDRLAGEE